MGTLWGLEKADAKPCFQGGMAPCNGTDWVLIHYNTAFQKRTFVSQWAVSRAGVNSVSSREKKVTPHPGPALARKQLGSQGMWLFACA